MSEGRVDKVLVIDDEPRLRELLVDALAADDLEITVASSGAEAVQVANESTPDLVVADLCLGDCTGLDVIDQLREQRGDLPAIVITGNGDADSLCRASRCRPVELMSKPLDLDRLRKTIRTELDRRSRQDHRTVRLRRLAREANVERKSIRHDLDNTCQNLTDAYRNLNSQMSIQKVVLNYQNELLSAKNDDDVFRSLFRLFVHRSGPVFGVALTCDATAELKVSGRFGVPYPDSLEFCQSLCEPLTEAILNDPLCLFIDAGDEAAMFDPEIRRYLPGVTVLAIPLIPTPGELIGIVVLYRKGEQPFTDGDVAIAEMIATPTAIAIRRND